MYVVVIYSDLFKQSASSLFEQADLIPERFEDNKGVIRSSD
jgi:hypothetical protein